ncbi:MAG: protein-L-isoaspartate(D-aspartate) O-methyltransferase [Halobacteriota archaeon]
MSDGDTYRRAREAMVDRLVTTGRIERDTTVEAMRAVPRHAFVPEARRSAAYQDRPLPIGRGQTISAPHMVATMVDLLALESDDRVLEIGTGCGYHAAVTAEVVGASNVYSIEVSPPLAEEARERLTTLGYGDISIALGDGSEGWPEEAPFDAIYLTCATPSIPDALLEQVRPGGRLLAPVGSYRQELVRITIDTDGTCHREHHGGVRFVPMRDRPPEG